MTTPALPSVDAKTVRSWLDADRAVLIDIREPDEYIREHIPQAHLVPLSAFNPSDFPGGRNKIAVFHCQMGGRTKSAAQQILATGFREVYVLQEGLMGWKAAGLPVNVNPRAPISIMRQVQIAAGSLVVLGIGLALLISPWFLGLSAFVGAGLIFSGASGTCMMADILSTMPWNRDAAARLGETQRQAPAH